MTFTRQNRNGQEKEDKNKKTKYFGFEAFQEFVSKFKVEITVLVRPV